MPCFRGVPTNLSPMCLPDLRILVLEDEFLIAMDVEQLCRDHGAADVIIKRSLDELERAQLADFDVAIVDLMLAGDLDARFARNVWRTRGQPFRLRFRLYRHRRDPKAFPGVPVVGKPYSGNRSGRGSGGVLPPAADAGSSRAYDPITCVEIASGPKSASPEIFRISCSRARARLTRLLIVPTAQSQISAASS